jgi:hypothetical protein
MSGNDKGHFSGRGQCEIHTSRSHRGCKVGGRKPGCNHQKNCETSEHLKKTGHREWVWGNEWNSHHALCVSCVNKYQVLDSHSKNRARIDAVYRKTKWCVNQEPNLIALPLRVVYERIDAALNLPCHEWDHNNAGGYADEVTQELHVKIWQKIANAAASKDPCKLAEAVAEKELARLAKAFKQKLARRGARKVGSKAGTKAAWAESQKTPSSRAEKWWYPFSMAKNSIAASSGPMTIGKPTISAADRKRGHDENRATRDTR